MIRKRDQYAAGGIPEYWLVEHPEPKTVTVRTYAAQQFLPP
ncbi:hypothetical protein HJG54_20165 [Leptolyngbya sp. NK1-12]|uniref:Restriction endonuclease domain-containing protein n=1 Tax=Leptolyngbya sp. NK1-12 TaxID=2547451 RepID=A0AA96WKD2_9CYAN|nr:hypothetical protein HJG54_20165 [Leptolyngbya sp. NK1-12]